MKPTWKLLLPFLFLFADNLFAQGIVMRCPPLNIQSYFEDRDTQYLGVPQVLFNRGKQFTMSFSDSIVTDGCDNGYDILYRTFKVFNERGDRDECVQTIRLLYQKISDFTFPGELTYMGNFDFDRLAIEPKLLNLSPNISYTINEVKPDTCIDEFEILRSITITDLCADTSHTFEQKIIITGYFGPEVFLKSQTNPDCFTNGNIQLIQNKSNPTYEWNNGNKERDISNLRSGSYSVTVTDVIGCQTTRSYTLMDEPSQMTGVFFTASDSISKPSRYVLTPIDHTVSPDLTVDRICYESLNIQDSVKYNYVFTNRIEALSSIHKLSLFNDDSYLEHITTRDIVMIQRFILSLLQYKYVIQYLASDINQSRTITASDIPDLRRLILGSRTSFPGPSWLYFPYRETYFARLLDVRIDSLRNVFDPNIYFIPLDLPILNNNILAVKRGDIDVLHHPKQNLMNGTPRTLHNLNVSIDNELIKKYTKHPIRITLRSNGHIEGYQFEFSVPNGINIDESSLAVNGIPYNILFKDGKKWIRFSYANQTGISQDHFNSEIQFTVTSNQDCYTKDMLHLTTDAFRPEAYDDDLNILELQMEFINSETQRQDAYLHFNDQQLHLKNVGGEIYTVCIADVLGRIIYHQSVSAENPIIPFHHIGTFAYTLSSTSGKIITGKFTSI